MREIVKLLSVLCFCLASGVASANAYCDRLAVPKAVYSTSSIIPLNTFAPRAALVSLYHPGLFDFIQTSNKEACNEALDFKGYTPVGTVAFIERFAQPGSVKFYGFWKDQPQTDHFYSSNASDIDYVLNNGWVPLPENEDVYLQSSSTAPLSLYRAHWFNHSTAEAAHYYSTSWTQIQQLINQGWIYDTVAGYAYPTATPQATVTTAGQSIQMGRRCQYISPSTPGNCFPNRTNIPSNYRDFQFNQYSLMGNGTKPAGKTVQKMSFSFDHSRYFKNSLHLAASLRANPVINTTNILKSTYYGMGISIGNFAAISCGFAGSGIAVEVFYPGGNMIRPEGCVSTAAFVEGARYYVAFQVDNAGNIAYTLKNSAGVTIASKQINAANSGWFSDPNYPFPASQGGHMLIDSGSNQDGDYDVNIYNYKTWWE